MRDDLTGTEELGIALVVLVLCSLTALALAALALMLGSSTAPRGTLL